MSAYSTRRLAGTALVVVLTILAGCTSGGESAGSAEHRDGRVLNVYIAESIQYAKEQRAWFRRIQTAFTKQTHGARVEFETYSGEELSTKLQTSAVSSSGPDIFSMGTTNVPIAYATGAFERLSPKDWKFLGGRDRFSQSQLDICGPTPDDNIAMPFVMRPYAMAYNTKMFKAAGITQPPSTWNELIDDAKKLTKNDRYGLVMDYGGQYHPSTMIWMFTLQNGGRFLSKDGKTVNLNSAEVTKAYKQYFDILVRDKVVSPDSVGWTGSDALANFSTGKAAMYVMLSPDARPTLDESPVAANYAFAPLPAVPPGESDLPAGGIAARSIVSGDVLAIASYSRNRDLAMEFLKLTTSADAQLHYYRQFGDLPAVEDALDQLVADDPVVKGFVTGGRQSVATPFTAAWGNIGSTMLKGVTQSLPDLSRGSYDLAKVRGVLSDGEPAAQTVLEREQARR